MFVKILTTAVVSLWIVTASASDEPSSKNSAIADKSAISKPHKGSDKHKSKTSFVKLSAFKIADKSGKIHLEMDKTGKTSYEGKVTGAIDAKGSVFDAGGKLMASLRDDSILVDSSGKPLVKIGTDGALDNESGELIHWLKDGSLAQGDKILDAKLLPSNSPARRAASILLFLHLNIRDVTQVEIPTTDQTTIKAFSKKPTGACYISSGAGNDCYPGLTQQGCYNTASKVGGTADWREGQSCSK